MTGAEQPQYDVLSPEGRLTTNELTVTPGAVDLDRAVVGQVWDYMFRGDDIFRDIRQALGDRHPGIRFVDYTEFGNIHGPDQDALTAQIPEKLRRHGCTAVIVGVGA